MTTRIHEYPLSPPARVAYTVRLLGIGIAVGAAAGFLLALGASITLNEAFIDIWYDANLDPLSRSLIPLLFAALGGGLLVFALGDSAYNWLFGRQLARAAASTPHLVAPHWQRNVILQATPLTGAVAATWSVFGLAALVAVAFLFILGETSDDEVAVVGGVAAGAAATAVAMVAIAVAVHAAMRRWPAVVETARVAWSRHSVREAEAADRARRPRGQKVGPPRSALLLASAANRLFSVGIGAIGIGTAIGFFGVFLRQPCRRCDERSYGSFGEALIDNLAIIGCAVTALGVLVLIVEGLTVTAGRIVSDAGLRHGASGMDAQRRPDGAMLQARLASTSLLEAWGILAAGLGAVATTTAASIATIDFPVDGAVTSALLAGGIALLCTAPVLAFAGVGYNLQLRSQLRERWAPADVPVVRPRQNARRG